MNVTLVILAAGIGTRYGGGVKQLAAVGPGGELIIDYSIHDALDAGFNKVVFIIRRDIYEDFREVIGCRMEAQFQQRNVKWEYVFQEMVQPPAGRTKPWGTGQAILSCKSVIHEPFAVINADDYYGKEAYHQAYRFLTASNAEAPGRYGMVGYLLGNTLSDNGGVTRGICELDSNEKLSSITETRNIVKTGTGASVKGGRTLSLNSLVSMNFWMFPPSFLGRLETGFAQFLAELEEPLTEEYLLPNIVDRHLHEGSCSVEVLISEDKWFGITYAEDKTAVMDAFHDLHDAGRYSVPLWK